MSAHIYNKNNELRFLSVIHNAGVGGSSPPVATKIIIKIKSLYDSISALWRIETFLLAGQPQRKKICATT